MIYDLGIESGEPGEGDVKEETGQTRPALLYDAHGGGSMDCSLKWSLLIVAPLTPCLINFGLPTDAIGAVVFHLLEPLLLSVSGSRHFDDVAPTASAPGDPKSDSEPSDGSREGLRDIDGGVSRSKKRPQPSVRDASVGVWNFKEPGGI